MYEFIDTTNTEPILYLPTEAVAINGEYLENLVQGFRTLYVRGRELIAPELKIRDVASRNGGVLLNRRYPTRNITVGYQLIAEDSSAFRNSFNKLADILNVTEQQFTFADEADKYFIGTPSEVGEIPPGKNAIVSEFSILCTDPFKYSVYQEEITPKFVQQANSEVFFTDYNGTLETFPSFEVEFTDDCGYIAFFDDEEHVLQFGNPSETDGEVVNKSQTLIDSTFTV